MGKVVKKFLLFKAVCLGILSVWSYGEAVLPKTFDENYPLVKDVRNFKESKGGIGFGPLGQILKEATSSRTFNMPVGKKEAKALKDEVSWQYAVVVNCPKGTALRPLLEKYTRDLIPSQERSRLSFVIGINERLTVDYPSEALGGPISWGQVLSKEDEDALTASGVPTLVLYSQWSAYRASSESSEVSALEIRKSFLRAVSSLEKRQKDGALERIRKEESAYVYPFGDMRSHVVNHTSVQQFIEDLEKTGSYVYLHSQDADCINLKETPRFLQDALDVKDSVVPEEGFLLKKYDVLIRAHYEASGRTYLPILVGGAHVYAPEEVLEKEILNQDAKKYWTRFASEMGNGYKHCIGQINPYGVYFHEPNTLILAPQSARKFFEGFEGEVATVRDRLSRGITFGKNSEMQDFTRDLFSHASDETCRHLMAFNAFTVLSTSMKRGKGKYFAIEFGGDFDKKTRTFSAWGEKDLRHIRSMPQEVIDPNAWMGNITTSFAHHREKDARTLVCGAFDLFDPVSRAGVKFDASYFYEVLCTYDDILREDAESIKTKFEQLRACYDKEHQGDLVAFYILSLSWENGQLMRSMCLNALAKPLMKKKCEVPNLQGVRQFLGQRLNQFQDLHGYPLPNPHVIHILGLDRVPRRMSGDGVVKILAQIVYEKNKKNQAASSRVFGTTSATLKKMLTGDSPKKAKEIAGTLKGKDPKAIAKAYDLQGGFLERLEKEVY